jgi:uncharacterized OsmC-like protein
MKRSLLWILVAVLFNAYAVGSVWADTPKDSTAAKNSTVYKVKVEVKEGKNRIIEGKVRNHTLTIDQPKEFGADDTAPTPPETVAFALGGCFVSTGRLIAMQKKLNVKSIEATVESELDFAKALGMPTEKRAGFAGFKIITKIDADMTAAEKEAFLKEIAAKCPMCDNLANPTPINYELAK